METKLNRKLVGLVLIFLVGLAYEATYYNGIVGGLRENTIPDGAFLFTTAVEVAYIDGDGNVVEKVLKVGDLPTKNFGMALGFMFASNSQLNYLSDHNDTVMKDTSGTERSIAAFPAAGTSQQDFVGITYARVGWGNGTTAATVNDYELNDKDDWDTVDQVIYFENSTHMWAKIQMTHEFTTGFTIKEVGLYAAFYEMSYSASSSSYYMKDLGSLDTAYDTNLNAQVYDASSSEGTLTANVGMVYGQYLLFRDVLGSPVTVPDNEAATITYWIYLQYG